MRQAPHEQMELPDRVALVGFMGSGKSTVGMLLGAALGYRFVDVDELTVEQAGLPIADIFLRDGEAAFRRLESRLLLGLAGSRRLVIATGGGAPTRAANRSFLRHQCRTFYLETSAAEVVRRIGGSSERPLLAGSAAGVEELLAARRRWYAQVGTAIATDGRTPQQVTAEIRARLGVCRSATDS